SVSSLRSLTKTGAPDRIRTYDLCLRRAALYPAELRVQERAQEKWIPVFRGARDQNNPRAIAQRRPWSKSRQRPLNRALGMGEDRALPGRGVGIKGGPDLAADFRRKPLILREIMQPIVSPQGIENGLKRAGAHFQRGIGELNLGKPARHRLV